MQKKWHNMLTLVMYFFFCNLHTRMNHQREHPMFKKRQNIVWKHNIHILVRANNWIQNCFLCTTYNPCEIQKNCTFQETIITLTFNVYKIQSDEVLNFDELTKLIYMYEVSEFTLFIICYFPHAHPQVSKKKLYKNDGW